MRPSLADHAPDLCETLGQRWIAQAADLAGVECGEVVLRDFAGGDLVEQCVGERRARCQNLEQHRPLGRVK